MSIEQLEVLAGQRRWRADLTQATSLATALDFDGAQPGFFGAPPATSRPLQGGGFIGDVRKGGSCNCSTYTLTPHCNGTHTECIGHVVGEDVSINGIAPRVPLIARLLTVSAVPAGPGLEQSEPEPHPGDRWITASSLEKAAGKPMHGCAALILRTLPNPEDKRHWQYDAHALPPYFSSDALRWIVAQGFEHLVVDLPSIDRAADEGRLSGHRIFWGLPPGSTRLADATRPRATITELAFIGNSLSDGLYLLDLQIAPFASDASPSRPLVYPLQALGS